jgi:hypothetical protein
MEVGEYGGISKIIESKIVIKLFCGPGSFAIAGLKVVTGLLGEGR